MCKIASMYCRLLKARVKELSENCDPSSAVNMVSYHRNNRPLKILFNQDTLSGPVKKKKLINSIKNSISVFCGIVVCSGKRSGAPTVSADPPTSAAELGGASREDTERDWRKPVSEHAPLAATAHAGHAEPRDSLGCRYSRPEGNNAALESWHFKGVG